MAFAQQVVGYFVVVEEIEVVEVAPLPEVVVEVVSIVSKIEIKIKGADDRFLDTRKLL